MLVLAAGLAAASPAPFPSVPAGRDADIRWIGPEGEALSGRAALGKMESANLVVWVAGNQYFAMDAVIQGFRRKHPGTPSAC
ncbi:MAG: hypothetical protein VKO21_07435 [Candidatus Sericytochromatia bacterium]|nr:hypothetical protein [Candidatus Sericytochromatia bacterium]